MMPDRDGMWTYDEVIAAWNMSKAREKLLREQLADAEEVLGEYTASVDGCHSRIPAHEDYLQKWGEGAA